MYRYLIIIVLICMPLSKAYSFTTLSSCLDPLAPPNCEEVYSCDGIDIAMDEDNKYYLLMNDVYAAATCFHIRASNATFDLNGKTVYYAQNLEEDCDIFEAGDHFTRCTAFRGDSHQNDITITNGYIVGAPNEYSHGIFIGSLNSIDVRNDNVKINNLDITVKGDQTQGIVLNQWGDDLEIHDVDINMDTNKLECSHFSGHILGIAISNRGGKMHIYNNRITGKAMGGINIGSCASWNSTPENPETDETMKIYDNYISMESPINDGYAIAVGANNNLCSDGTEIFGNTIDQINGRGIMIGGSNVNSDHGPGNFNIYENNISVQEGSDCENAGYGLGVGLRIRFGAHDIWFHDNYITGIAGPEAGVDHHVDTDGNILTDGGDITGMFISSGNPHGVNNVIERNFIDVSTSDPDMHAIAVEVAGGETYAHSMLTQFRNNTFKSNNRPIRIATGGDGPGYNAHFDSDIIIKGDNPINYEDIGLGTWYWGVNNIHLKNITGQNGADVHDPHIYICPPPCEGYTQEYIDDIKIIWTLDTKVIDKNNNPVKGAQVTVTDAYGTEYTGLTGDDGIVSKDLTEIEYFGQWEISSTSYNPYSIKAELLHNGTLYSAEENDISLTSRTIKTLQFTGLDDGGADTTPPFISNGQPSSSIPADTDPVIISVNTDEPANCRFSNSGDVYYDAMFEDMLMIDSDPILHEKEIPSLGSGDHYFYVKCRDKVGNTNLDDYEIHFYKFPVEDPQDYLCGDVNDDGTVDLNDVYLLIDAIFRGGSYPDPEERADADQSGNIDIADLTYLIRYIFEDGPSPCSVPSDYAKLGADWTEDEFFDYFADHLDSESDLTDSITSDSTSDERFSITGGCGLASYSTDGKISHLFLLISLLFTAAIMRGICRKGDRQ